MRGDWIQTYTGRKFWPLDPRPEDIDIRDIAHALSLVCRFGGHCREFYSVAQHSWLVANHAGPFALWGLLHDAAEAYLGDLTRPLKYSLRTSGQTFYAEAESRVMLAVCAKFNIPQTQPESVKVLDHRALLAEKRDILDHQLDWGFPQGRIDLEPLTDKVMPWNPALSEAMFLDAFGKLVNAPTQ